MEVDVTYRVIAIDDAQLAGRTAATPELATLVAGDLIHSRHLRLGMERTDWGEHYGRPRAIRTVLIEAEKAPGEWVLGP